MRIPLTSTMMWECLNVCLTIICQPLSQTSEHYTSDKRYWVRIMRRPLTATLTWGLKATLTWGLPKDNTSATESHMQALNIRQKVLGDDRENTIYSHFNLGITQFVLKDNNLTQVTQASTKHQTKRNWVKIMRTPLTATSTWGLPNICLRITPQPLSHTNEH